MKNYVVLAAILLQPSSLNYAKAESSIEELKARVERAEKRNLLLKAERLERENFMMEAQALENKNSSPHADVKPKTSAVVVTAISKHDAHVVNSTGKSTHYSAMAAGNELHRAVNVAIDSISKDDPRRELNAKAIPVSSVETVVQTDRKSWSGIYAGINAGYGANDIYLYTTTVGLAPNLYTASTGQNTPIIGGTTSGSYFGGPVVGGQVGYNHEFNNRVVLGGEVDLNYADINNSHIQGTPNYSYNLTPGTAVISTSASRTGLDWIGTARARLGYSLGNFLPFVTGGVAYGQLSTNGAAVAVSDYSNNTPSFAYRSGTTVAGSGNYSSVNFGWAAGAGAEYLVAANWSVKGEYLYTQLSGLGGQNMSNQTFYSSGTSMTSVNSGGPLSTYATMGAFGIHQARVGLNYHTDWLTGKSSVSMKF
jgi:outer membrane immunogenic protein